MKTQSKKDWVSLVIMLALVLAVAFFALRLEAKADGSKMGFSVTPIYPENQSDENLGYFDITLSPLDKQQIFVTIRNLTDEEKVFQLSVDSAGTTPTGTIVYHASNSGNTRIEKNEIGIATMASLENDRITIPAKELANISIDIVAPKETFDGVLLGGIKVVDITKEIEREKEEATSLDSGTLKIYNEYAATIAIAIRKNESQVEPNFKALDINTALIDLQPTLIVPIQNTENIIVKNALFTGTISSNNKDILHVEKLSIDMAPSSIMSYEFSETNDIKLAEGKTLFTGKIEYNGKTWDFSQSFNYTAPIIKIPPQNSQEGIAASQNQQEKVSGSNKNIAIVAAVVAVAAGAVGIRMYLKAKRKLED